MSGTRYLCTDGKRKLCSDGKRKKGCPASCCKNTGDFSHTGTNCCFDQANSQLSVTFSAELYVQYTQGTGTVDPTTCVVSGVTTYATRKLVVTGTMMLPYLADLYCGKFQGTTTDYTLRDAASDSQMRFHAATMTATAEKVGGVNGFSVVISITGVNNGDYTGITAHDALDGGDGCGVPWTLSFFVPMSDCRNAALAAATATQCGGQINACTGYNVDPSWVGTNPSLPATESMRGKMTSMSIAETGGGCCKSGSSCIAGTPDSAGDCNPLP